MMSRHAGKALFQMKEGFQIKKICRDKVVFGYRFGGAYTVSSKSLPPPLTPSSRFQNLYYLEPCNDSKEMTHIQFQYNHEYMYM